MFSEYTNIQFFFVISFQRRIHNYTWYLEIIVCLSQGGGERDEIVDDKHEQDEQRDDDTRRSDVVERLM